MVVFISTACEPPLRIRVTNETDRVLSIFVNINSKTVDNSTGYEYDIGKVEPENTISKELERGVVGLQKITIMAEDQNGSVVFSKDYTNKEWILAGQRLTITQADLLAIQ